VNDLLQRKSSWDDKDLIRFTSLVREEHTYEQEEFRAKGEVARSEQAVDQSFDELIRAILNRLDDYT
jgi:sensitive to high expression protein 9, mitochondrial